ncbi:MAG TPA: Fe-S cluster assembly ATPase SufC [Acidimicrobiales bacterium]|jgi:Fe-S cluster assembly ATP-binding protein|nr:Fe-S cluster assembly ATPase SufC [Acidimicrobiales bacterium]
MPKPLLELRNVHAEAEGSSILRGVDLVVNEGEVHALMGPNGAGKSTLASVVMGHPGYRVTNGEILLRGEDISTWTADTRARAGIFLAFQYPEAISGVSVIQFLRQAIAARKGLDELSVLEVRLDLAEWMERLGIDSAFAERHLNDGFSGGERKRNEVLQMALLEPIVALLDETDSGLDIDALKIVANGVRTVRDEHPSMGAVVVTHYVKLLDEIRPDYVHILVDGRIVHTGGAELAEAIDRDGYDAWRPVNA